MLIELTVLVYHWGPTIVTSVTVALGAKHTSKRVAGTIMNVTANQPILATDTTRSEFVASDMFRSQPITNDNPTTTHTHGIAAAERSDATKFINLYARRLGLEPYDLCSSDSQIRRGVSGTRPYHTAKDTTSKFRMDPIPQRHMKMTVDVDFHLEDFSDELDGSLMVVYTFVPTRVARSYRGTGGEYSFHFDEDDTVHYTVAGGAIYSHKVWDHSRDVLSATQWLFGIIPWRVTTYKVERRQMDEHHQVVAYLPAVTHRWLAAPIAWLYSTPPLRRLNICREGVCTLLVNSPQGQVMSIGKPKSYAEASMPAHQYDGLCDLAQASKLELPIGSIESVVRDPNSAETASELKLRAATLTVPVRKGRSPTDKVTTILPRTNLYTFHSPNEPLKPAMIAFMDPIISGSYVPSKDATTEKRGINGRVIEKQRSVSISPFMEACAREFSVLIVPESGALRPTDLNVTYENMKRPSQRVGFERGMVTVSNSAKPKVSTFMKAESYAGTKDPRIITTLPPADAMRWSTYVSSLSALVKDLPCYAFSRSPRGVAERVADICSKSNQIALRDFVRFDGTQNNYTRLLERLILLRAFPDELHSDIVELHSKMYSTRAYATFGNSYETLWTRLSGEFGTSLFNTLINLFVSYIAFRMTQNPQTLSTYTPAEAWTAVRETTIAGGDDGLDGLATPEKINKAAKLCGLDLELDVIPRHGTGVMFLSRLYSPYVWSSIPDSMCDIKRTLLKLHLSTPMPVDVTAEDKLVQRALGLLSTDRNTPIVGEFAQVVMSNSTEPIAAIKKKFEGASSMTSYMSDGVSDDQKYPNEYGEWMNDAISIALPDFDHETYDIWKWSCSNLTQLLQPPLCWEAPKAPVKRVVFVNDQWETPDSSVPLDLPSEELLRPAPPMHAHSNTTSNFNINNPNIDDANPFSLPPPQTITSGSKPPSGDVKKKGKQTNKPGKQRPVVQLVPKTPLTGGSPRPQVAPLPARKGNSTVTRAGPTKVELSPPKRVDGV